MCRTFGPILSAILLAGILGVLARPVPVVGQSQENAKTRMERGAAALKAGAYIGAVGELRAALQLQPEMTEAEVLLGEAYYGQVRLYVDIQDNLRLAQESFERVLRKDPDNIHATFGLAAIYVSRSDFDRAREVYLKAVKLAPDDPLPYYQVGTVAFNSVYQNSRRSSAEKLRLIDEGLSHLDKAVTLAPLFPDGLIFHNLLLREKATLAGDTADRDRIIAQANESFDKALRAQKINNEALRANKGQPVYSKLIQQGVITPAPPPPPPPPPVQ
jgi:tetratricopeptide (TPR) repeat protein